MIHIVAANNIEKGKALEGLTADLLKNLGYTDIRTRKIRDSGEIDVAACRVDPFGEDPVKMNVICECKALSKPLDMPKWDTFKGKYLSQVITGQLNTLAILVSLSGATSPVLENYRKFRESAATNSIRLFSDRDVIRILIDLGKLADPEKINKTIEDRCPGRLGSTQLAVVPSTDEIYRCYWVQHLLDDRDSEAYATLLSGIGDTIPSSANIVDELYLAQIDREYIPFRRLRLENIIRKENTRHRINPSVAIGRLIV